MQARNLDKNFLPFHSHYHGTVIKDRSEKNMYFFIPCCLPLAKLSTDSDSYYTNECVNVKVSNHLLIICSDLGEKILHKLSFFFF